VPQKLRSVSILLLCAGLIGAATPGSAAISGTTNLISAGSTFIYPMLGKWITEFQKTNPGVQVSYDPVGSGRGISRTLAGTVDFGASDGPLTDDQVRRAPKQILHVPVVLGAVVPVYNLPGVSQDLRFTPACLAGIFLGTITRWNDPEMARANPGIHLPANEMKIVFRTDGSGTTYVWSDYLSKVSPEWKRRAGAGTSIQFPVGTGAQFNEGVVDYIKGHPWSFGYLQLTYAERGGVRSGLVQNAAGNYIKADSASTAAAAASTQMPDDFRVSITNPAAANAYPIASFTWLLVPARIDDSGKRTAIAGLLRWVLTDGQKLAAPMHHAPLPGDVAHRVLEVIDRIQ